MDARDFVPDISGFPVRRFGGFSARRAARRAEEVMARGLLTVSVSATEPSVLVSVAGEADMTVSGQLGESLGAMAGTRYLVVDASRLNFIDVACVRVLVGVCGAAEDAGGALVLVAPQPIVARMLKLCRADQRIAVYGSTQGTVEIGSARSGARNSAQRRERLRERLFWTRRRPLPTSRSGMPCGPDSPGRLPAQPRDVEA